MTIERLIGFDTRFVPRLVSSLWDARRRDDFLICPDVATPLSVDNLVWPSLFNSKWLEGELKQPLIQAPGYTGPNGGLWSDLDEMTRFIQSAGYVEPEMCCILAISCFVDEAVTDLGHVTPFMESYIGPYFDAEPTQPQAPDSNWRLLGYDVADGSRLSGLSHCGIVPHERELLRTQWATDLNRFHLFDERERAGLFARQMDERAPEHASFFVYALRLVAGGVE